MSNWRDDFHHTLGANILHNCICPPGATTDEALASLLVFIDGAAGALADHAMLAHTTCGELNPFNVSSAASLLQMATRIARELGEVALTVTPAGERKA
jgi:hypothetical protein